MWMIKHNGQSYHLPFDFEPGEDMHSQMPDRQHKLTPLGA